MTLVDPWVTKQAEILVDYSLRFKKGESALILGDFESKPLLLELYRLLIKKGASLVRTHITSYEFDEIYFKNSTKEQIKLFPTQDLDEIKGFDCYIRIAGVSNTRGLTGSDSQKIAERMKILRPILDYRVEHTRWVVTRFPTESQAQEADMSLAEYEEFVFNAICKVDWSKKFKEQEKLAKLLTQTKNVRIVGPETDLILYKQGRKAINGGGDFNMPDGEVFTSVLESSANGYITYSFPALYLGKEFHNVRLEFKKGVVVKATADKGESDLNKILNMDKGSRIIGELGIGNNYSIKKFTKDILFDEKIGGSVHLALGNGYKDTGSKNESGLHWDMIKDLKSSGELWFDERLVQKNGRWLINI